MVKLTVCPIPPGEHFPDELTQTFTLIITSAVGLNTTDNMGKGHKALVGISIQIDATCQKSLSRGFYNPKVQDYL